MREGWRTGTFADVVEPDVVKVDVVDGEEYPILGVFGFGRGLLHREPATSRTTRYKQLNAVRSGQLIYSKLKAFEGAITVVPSGASTAYASAEFPTYSCTPAMLPEYLRLITQRPTLWEAFASLSKGVGGRRERLNPIDLLTVPVTFPPISEQRRIVDLIGALDGTIAAAEASTQALKDALAARRDLAFSTPQCRPASKMFDILIGLQRSPARAEGPHQTKYLRSANVLPGRLNLEDVKMMSFDEPQRAKYSLQPGDVLVSEGSASAEAVGAPSEYHGELEDVVCFQNTLLRYRAIPGVTTPAFVSQWCSWAYESGAFREAANGTNIKHIGSGGASRMFVADVPFAQQPALTAELEKTQMAAEKGSVVIRTLGALRSNLLTALLSGEHEIPGTYDEVLQEAV